MRTSEIVLLVANVAAVLLAFKKQSKQVWLGIAGANLAVLLLHGLLEGFRWQMAFAYAFVAVWVVLALLMASGKVSVPRIPKVFRVTGKIVGLGVASLLLMATALLAQALPVFTLPKPTGEYAVGIQYLHLTDENRVDPFIAASGQKRELMAKVYYPAESDAAKPYARYFNGSQELMQAYAGFYRFPSVAFSHFGQVKTHAKNDLEVSGKEQKYPVVLFSHGAGASAEVSTAQSQDLASRGYIVVAIDHPYVSAATAFPGRMVTAAQATANFDVPEPAEPITQIMADDMSFVIDQLGELQESDIDPAFKDKIDLEHIGVIGHSVGGAAAYNLAASDSRIKAAVNLDGKVFVTPKDPQKMAPFLMLANDKNHLQAIQNREPLMETFDDSSKSQRKLRLIYGDQAGYDAEYRKQQQYAIALADTLKASDNLYTVRGSDHMKFTDIGLFIGNPWLRDLLQISGSTDPKHCLEATSALTAAFFDQHLRGSANSVGRTTRAYPELNNITLN